MFSVGVVTFQLCRSDCTSVHVRALKQMVPLLALIFIYQIAVGFMLVYHVILAAKNNPAYHLPPFVIISLKVNRHHKVQDTPRQRIVCDK